MNQERKRLSPGDSWRLPMLWALMLLIGVAAFAAMFGFTLACERR
jgi:hypothetical protein